jgi:DNA repair ATPase RecN
MRLCGYCPMGRAFNEARAELKHILDEQKTVSITRLKRIIDTLGYDEKLNKANRRTNEMEAKLRKLTSKNNKLYNRIQKKNARLEQMDD